MAKKTAKKKPDHDPDNSKNEITNRNNRARIKDIAALEAKLIELQVRVAHLEELSGTW